MGMDREGQLSKEMVEQLLKYVPTSAEVELLESHALERDNFARADSFLLEVSRWVGLNKLRHTPASFLWKEACLP